FYLLIAVGGVLGGLFNSLLAPVVFTSLLEYPVAVGLACVVARPFEGSGRPRTILTWVLDLAVPAALVGVYVGGFALMGMQKIEGEWIAPTFAAVLAASCLLFMARPVRAGLGVLALLAIAVTGLGSPEQVLHAERTFFGVHRVVQLPDEKAHKLLHGVTV